MLMKDLPKRNTLWPALHIGAKCTWASYVSADEMKCITETAAPKHSEHTHTLGAHTHSGHTNSEHTHTLSFICRAHSLLQCNIHFTYYPARAFPASLAYSKALHLLTKGYNCARKKLYIISVSCIIRIIQKKKNPPRTSLPVWALHSFAIVALFIVFSHLNSLMRTA